MQAVCQGPLIFKIQIKCVFSIRILLISYTTPVLLYAPQSLVFIIVLITINTSLIEASLILLISMHLSRTFVCRSENVHVNKDN